MKRILTLLFAFTFLVLPLLAQEIDQNFAFVDENEAIIENGSTIIRSTVENDEGTEIIKSGVSVKNISGTTDDFLRIIYTISQLDNGHLQICFPMTCNDQNQLGTFETGSGRLMGEVQDMMSEWFPTADGTCVVSYQIEVMTRTTSFSYIHKAYGPTIIVKFVKGGVPEPEPIRGDVNGDNEVSVADVNTLINCVLDPSVINPRADVNDDNEVSVADVNALIGIILNPAPSIQMFTVNGVSFKMIPVEGGSFTMGATADDSDAFDWEYPAHQVTLSSYSIGETEVTQALWAAVMGSNPSTTQGDVNLPVESVSWDDCQTFIAKLNQMTGKHFRLPTEAEWEYAARGGNKSKNYRYAGSNDINEVAWWDGNACNGVGFLSPDYGTHIVASKKGNELGVYDMSGNVIEWCNDWFGAYWDESQTNPIGPTSGSLERVCRGGYWGSGTPYCRVSYRTWNIPGESIYNVGLRLAL